MMEIIPLALTWIVVGWAVVIGGIFGLITFVWCDLKIHEYRKSRG